MICGCGWHSRSRYVCLEARPWRWPLARKGTTKSRCIRTRLSSRATLWWSCTRTLHFRAPTDDGTLPTNHQLHETIEITHGFNDWFETGFYIFTSAKNGQGWDYVGSHIRPRVRVPPNWHWPVGISLSNEIGWQSRRYSADTWTWEIRPIIDRQLGPWYLSFNPTFDRSFHGPGVNQGLVFSPNFKFSYNFTKKIAGGLEYYGSLGPVTGFDPVSQQQQQILPAIDLNLSPKWEVNFGLGVGVTRATDHLLAKMILGYRFDF